MVGMLEPNPGFRVAKVWNSSGNQTRSKKFQTRTMNLLEQEFWKWKSFQICSLQNSHQNIYLNLPFRSKTIFQTSHIFIIFGLPRAACWFLVSPIWMSRSPRSRVESETEAPKNAEGRGGWLDEDWMMAGWWRFRNPKDFHSTTLWMVPLKPW